VVLSPRDWGIVSDWHARKIPLQIVEEAMEAAVERGRKRGRPPRAGLSYLAHAVDDAWTCVASGRLEDGPGETRDPSPASALAAWHRRIDAEPAGSALAELLAGLLRRLEGGESPEALDAELDRRLAETAESHLLRRVEQDLERDLEPHRGRISSERLEATRGRAMAQRLRLRLGLPRLATRQPRR
jgi:hypothetical protein